MAYEIRHTVTPTRNFPDQYTKTTTTTESVTLPNGIDHKYNHWATTSRLAQGYYNRPQYNISRATSSPTALASSATTTTTYGPGGVYTTRASHAPARSYAIAGVRSGPPYAPGTYTTQSATSYTPTYNPVGRVTQTYAVGTNRSNNWFQTATGRWPAHDLFQPNVGSGATAVRDPSKTGTSVGYHHGKVPPAELTPGASGFTADRATIESCDVYASELRPAVLYEKRIRKENEEIQDVVDRTRYTTDIRQVIQPVHHTVNLTEKSEQKSLGIVKRQAAYNSTADQIERYERQRKIYPSGTLIDEGGATHKSVVHREPVIRERIRARVIEEIQPVVYREIVQPVRVISTQPIHETVIHGASVREIFKAEPISFGEFERRGYRIEGRERQENVNRQAHVLI